MRILVFVLDRVMMTTRISFSETPDHKYSLFLDSCLIMISPLTVRFRRLGRSDKNNCISASVLIRDGQKPWNVSAFSHHVCMRISSAVRPLTSIDSRSDSSVSRWLLIKKAKGMTRLLCQSQCVNASRIPRLKNLYLDKSCRFGGGHARSHSL